MTADWQHAGIGEGARRERRVCPRVSRRAAPGM